jgi:vancomycin resistance protein YoaR
MSLEKPRKKPALIAGIVAGAIVLLLVAGIAVAGFIVNGTDTVFPNISISGVELGGMTRDQARQALIDAGYEERTKNVSVSVNFPDDGSITMTGEEAGIQLSAENAAKIAYEYGRDGSFFGNEFAYIKCLLSPNTLEDSEATKINEEYVRGVVKEYTENFNRRLLEEAYKIDSVKIEIIKGAGSALADENSVFDLVVASLLSSLESSSPVTADYTVTSNNEDEVNLESVYDSIFVEPKSAVYDPETYSVVPSVTGVSFDLKDAQVSLESAADGSTVVIPLIYTEPEVTTDMLNELLFRDVLSERRTYVAGTSNRVNNVRLAAAAINGKILNPGEEFSYNGTVGERTAAKGYKEAGAYVGGKTVQEIGGGICQVSSTIYACVLYADLEVTDRSNHMFTVSYLPLGIDATVNWGTVDFKFKNNTPYPIKIECYMDGGYLQVKLHGTKLDENYIKVDYVVLSEKGFSVVQKEDASIAPGETKEETSGHTGYVVETYKYLYDKDGNLISKTYIARSSYKSQDKVILVPVGTLTGVGGETTPTDTEIPTDTEPTQEPSDEPSDEPMADPSEDPFASPTEPFVTPTDGDI